MMEYIDCFTAEQIKRTFTIECFQKDDLTFNKTHYPLHFLLHRPGPGEKDKITNEDTLLEDWDISLKERKQIGSFIRPYVIWGAPGTGKTELCRLLELKIKERNQDYQVIRISKRDLAMGGILGIAQKLNGNGIDIGDVLLQDVDDERPNALFAYVLKLIEQNKQFFQIQANPENKKKIFDILGMEIVENIKERKRQLSSDDISNIETSLEFLKNSTSRTRNIYDENQSLLGRVSIETELVNSALYKRLIPLLMETESVEKLIYNEIQKINNYGKIPVFIFDDVTFVGTLIQDLISVITDISGDSGYICDFVIGTTTDFYKKYFTEKAFATAQARITEIKLSPDQTGSKNANWLVGTDGLGHFLDFCLKYINASYTVNKEEVANNVPSIFIDGKDVYYPYSKTFLINLYHRILHEEKKRTSGGLSVVLSPRYVIQVLRASLSPFFQLKRLPSENIHSSFDMDTQYFFQNIKDYQKYESYYLAIWWYGTQTGNGQVELPITSIRELGLEDHIPSVDLGKDIVTYSVVNLDTAYNNISNLENTGISEIRPKDHSVEELKSTIQKWMNGDTNVEFSRNTVIKGINYFIKSINNATTGGKNSSNYLNRKSSREIKDRVKALQYKEKSKYDADFEIAVTPKKNRDKFTIYFLNDGKQEVYEDYLTNDTLYLYLTVDDYYNIYRIGARTDNDGSAYQTILFRHGDAIKSLIHKQNFLRKQQLESALHVSLEAYVLSHYLIMGQMQYPYESLMLSNLDWRTVYQYFDISEHPQSKYLIYTDLPPNLQSSIPSNDDFKIAEGLVLSLFTLRGDGKKRGVIDYPLLMRTLQEIQKSNPYSIIMDAASAEVDPRFVITPSDKTFQKYISGLQKSLGLLCRNKWNFDYDLYDKLHSYIEKVGDHHKFNDECGEFIKNYSSTSQEIRDLKRDYGKFSQSDLFEETCSELEGILSYVEKSKSASTDIERSIIETLCMYRLDTLSRSSSYIKFLELLEDKLGRVNESLNREVQYNLDQLKSNIQKFISFVQGAEE